jgi:hypothetical protein
MRWSVSEGLCPAVRSRVHGATRGSKSLPFVDQALRPQADAATQASARFIEEEAIDFAEHYDHSHSDGSH